MLHEHGTEFKVLKHFTLKICNMEFEIVLRGAISDLYRNLKYLI